MNNKNGKLIIIQAVIVTTLFLAIIGVYCFQTIRLDTYQQENLAQLRELEHDINALELTMTNHCSNVGIRLDHIELDITEIKQDIKGLYGE